MVIIKFSDVLGATKKFQCLEVAKKLSVFCFFVVYSQEKARCERKKICIKTRYRIGHAFLKYFEIDGE